MRINRILYTLSSILGITSLIFWVFLPAVQTIDNQAIISFRLVDATFGYYSHQSPDSSILNFSIFNFLTLLVLLIAISFNIFRALEIRVFPKYDSIISSALLLISGILSLNVIGFMHINDANLIKDNLVLTITPFLIFGVNIVSALINIYVEYYYDESNMFVKENNKNNRTFN